MSKLTKAISVMLALALLCGLVPMMTIGSSAADGTELQFDANGKFRFLQISDIQDDESVDATTISMITKAIARYDPDMVVLTGDNIKNNVNESDFKKSATAFLQPMIDAGVRYAVTFGNHDDEGLLAASKTTQYDWYIGHSSLAIDFDVDELSGVGTGVIPIKSADGTRVAFAIYPTDSGTYDSNDNYDYVKTDQINWYNSMCTTLKARNNGNPVPSLVFQHIPVPEIYNLLKIVSSGTSGCVQGTGSRTSNYYILDPTNSTVSGKLGEGPCPSEVNNGQFASWKSGDSNMVGAYFGHDHTNSFVGTYNGIKMGYCKAATLQSYNDGDPGCRYFELNENGTYTTQSVSVSTLNVEEGGEFLHDEIPGTPTVPKNIIVGAAGNGISQQAFGTTIQLNTLNHKTQALTPVDRTIKFNIPAIADATVAFPTLSVTTGVSVTQVGQTAESDGSTTFEWQIAGGTASAGGTVEYIFDYTVSYGDGRTTALQQRAYSYIDNIKSPAGYYVFTRNYRGGDSSGNYISTKLVMTMLGETVYGNTREHVDADIGVGAWDDKSGYYNYNGTDDGGYVSMGNDYNYGLNFCSPSRIKFGFEFTRHNLAGQAPVATIYADRSAATNVSDLGATINYWRTGNQDNSTLSYFMGFGMKTGDVGYTAGDALTSTTTAVTTNWASGDTLGATRGANKNFNLTGGTIPTNGTQITMVSKIRAYNNSIEYETEHNVYLPILLNFVTYNKTNLKTALNVERLAKRQAADYSEYAFVSYETAFRQAYKVVNKINTNQTEIDAALNGLNTAVTNLTMNAVQISDNGQYAGNVTVPATVYVAGTGYGTSAQPQGSVIQPQLVDFFSSTMVNATAFSIALPTGASEASVAITTGSGVAVSFNFDAATGQGSITGGTAVAGDYIKYVFSYTMGTGADQKTYTQIAGSYVDNAPQATGWSLYIRRDSGSKDTSQLMTQFIAPKGVPASGVAFDSSHTAGTKYGVNLTNASYDARGVAGTSVGNWDVDRYDTVNWYCGRTGADSRNEGGDVTSNRAIANIYLDVSKISSVGAANIYYRAISNNTQSDMGNCTFAGAIHNGNVETDAGAGVASWIGLATATSTALTSTAGSTFNTAFTGSALPADGAAATLHTAFSNNSGSDLTTHCAWLMSFHVTDKTVLRNKVNFENGVFRQLHDGYSNANGKFTAYQNALALASAQQGNPRMTTTANSTAADDLQLAVDGLEYVLADYSSVNAAIEEVYDTSNGYYRPNNENDPTYYALGTYYPRTSFRSTNEVDIPIECVDWTLTIQYQEAVDAMADAILYGWKSVTLSDADYTQVDLYLGYRNGTEHSIAGDTIRANNIRYPSFNKEYIDWSHYTVDSYAIWEDAVTNAVNHLGLKVPDQAIVTGCGTDLRRAYLGYNSTTDPDYVGETPLIVDGLTLKAANYAQLDALIEDINTAMAETVTVVNPAFASQNYTIPFYSPTYTAQIDALLDTYTPGLYSPNQDQVDALYAQLLTLYEGLGSNLNNADYTYANAQKDIPADYEFDGANNDVHANYYTDASWATLVAARNAIINGFQTDEQGTVNGYAQAIYNARANLQYKPADYSQIQAIVDEAATLTQSDYTNWAVYQQAEDDIVWTYNATQQAQVSIAYNKLVTAFYGLTLKDANYTNLQAAITAGQAYAATASNYVTETYQALANAVADGQTTYNRRPTYKITEQATVDAATTAINNAIAGLTYKAAIVTDLQTAYEASTMLPDYAFIDEYGESEWTPVGTAMATAASILARFNEGQLNITHQAEIDAATSALNTAMAGLHALYAEYDLYLSEVPEDLTIFTDDSVEALNTAIDAVVRGKMYVEQATVDGYAADLLTAIDGLTHRDANLTALIAAIIAADNAISGIDTSWFTADTWSAYQTAYNAAGTIRDATPVYSILEQDDVDAATAALTGATSGLAYKDADYTAIDAAVAAAAALTPADYISFADVDTAVTAAKVYTDASPRALKIDSQTMLDGLAQDITDAIAALQLKPTEIHLVAAPGSNTIIDTDRHYIYGLQAGLNLTSAADLIQKNLCTLDGDGYITYTPAGNNTKYGTGTKVEVFRNGETLPDETYYIVIFGDVTGDGSINSMDVYELVNSINDFDTSVDLSNANSPAKFAANLGGGSSLVINAMDLSIIINHINDFSIIDQSGAQNHESQL